MPCDELSRCCNAPMEEFEDAIETEDDDIPFTNCACTVCGKTVDDLVGE